MHTFRQADIHVCLPRDSCVSRCPETPAAEAALHLQIRCSESSSHLCTGPLLRRSVFLLQTPALHGACTPRQSHVLLALCLSTCLYTVLFVVRLHLIIFLFTRGVEFSRTSASVSSRLRRQPPSLQPASPCARSSDARRKDRAGHGRRQGHQLITITLLLITTMIIIIIIIITITSNY